MGKQYASPSSTGFGQDFSIDQCRSDHFWLEIVITAGSFSRSVVFFLKERKIINSSGKKFTDAAGIEPSGRERFDQYASGSHEQCIGGVRKIKRKNDFGNDSQFDGNHELNRKTGDGRNEDSCFRAKKVCGASVKDSDTSLHRRSCLPPEGRSIVVGFGGE